MQQHSYSEITTLGQLKMTDYQSKSIKTELRDNLIKALQAKKTIFEGVLGFDDTVLPDLERAILSRHNILLLGLRGQAKTRIARLLTQLLDEYIPVVAGSDLNDDPLAPLSRKAKDLIAEMGDATPISWLHRSERYIEKLATPDVSVADLIGDIDPIKAATLKLPYSDERVIHFGLVPRAHRCIFVINELPDLQARIQVSLFNILQEGDIQIRGFKLRLPLDIEFMFTANPEDYTNRGSIITPLKDRIESQILTHYPKNIEISRQITQQEAKLTPSQQQQVSASLLVKNILERIAFAARESEFVDEKSGVSARLTIAAYENLISSAERRMLLNGEKETSVRIGDFWGIIPAITGKIELVYEGEQEGPYNVALQLFHQALKEEFLTCFPNPNQIGDKDIDEAYSQVLNWFSAGNEINLLNDDSQQNYEASLQSVEGLEALVYQFSKVPTGQGLLYMELCLHALAEFEMIEKSFLNANISFKDPLSDALGDLFSED